MGGVRIKVPEVILVLLVLVRGLLVVVDAPGQSVTRIRELERVGHWLGGGYRQVLLVVGDAPREDVASPGGQSITGSKGQRIIELEGITGSIGLGPEEQVVCVEKVQVRVLAGHDGWAGLGCHPHMVLK